MDNSKYEKSFELILHAGNAKYNYLCAIKAVKDQELSKVKEYMNEGDKEMHFAHKCQTDLITKEMNGESVNVNILSVHAQDHLTMAVICKDQANQLIDLYQEIANLKKQINELKMENIHYQ